jgi:hypothetical protein
MCVRPSPTGASNLQPVLHHAGVVSAQSLWGIHLLFNTACGLPNRDLARPDHILNNPVGTLSFQA